MSFDSIESTQSIGSIQSNLISEISVMSLENNYILEPTEEGDNYILEPTEDDNHILDLTEEDDNHILDLTEEAKKSEDPKYMEFPNDAYKDLIILVTEHKLNNKAGNDIIHFFNKHSNLTKSPLPKNIEIDKNS
jgi:hypothetical protein